MLREPTVLNFSFRREICTNQTDSSSDFFMWSAGHVSHLCDEYSYFGGKLDFLLDRYTFTIYEECGAKCFDYVVFSISLTLALQTTNKYFVVVTLFPTKYMKSHICITHLQNCHMYCVSGCQKKPRLIELTTFSWDVPPAWQRWTITCPITGWCEEGYNFNPIKDK